MTLRTKLSKPSRYQERYNRRIYLACDLQGEPSSQASKYNTSSKRYRCLHQVSIVNEKRTQDDEDGGAWTVKVVVAGRVANVTSRHEKSVRHPPSLSVIGSDGA